MDDTTLGDLDQQVQRDADHAEDDERGEHASDVGHGLRLCDDDADAFLRAEEFGDDGAEQSVDHAHVEAGKDIGCSGRQLDPQIGLQPRGRQRLHQVEPFRLGRADAGKTVHQHRKEGEQRGHHHLGAVAEAAPDDDQGRDGDLRQALQRERVRHQDDFRRTEFRHQRAEQEPQGRADQKAERGVPKCAAEREIKADAAVERNGEPGPQRVEDALRPRKDIGRNLEYLDRNLPQHQQTDHPGDGEQDIADALATALCGEPLHGAGGEIVRRGNICGAHVRRPACGGFPAPGGYIPDRRWSRRGCAGGGG